MTYWQLAEMANTTPGYVAKVKSQLKSRMGFATNQIDKPIHQVILDREGGIRVRQGESARNNLKCAATKVAINSTSTNQKEDKGNKDNNAVTDLTVPQFSPSVTDANIKKVIPLSSSLNLVPGDYEERKKLWKEFNANTPIPVLIEKYGYSSDAVIAEHKIFQQYSVGYNIEDVQRRIITSISGRLEALSLYPELAEKYERMIKSYNEKHYLTSKELSEALSLSNSLSYEIGIDSVANTDERAPKGWTKLLCKKCAKPLYGVVFDQENKKGAAIKELYKSWAHSKCNNTSSDINSNNTSISSMTSSDIK